MAHTGVEMLLLSVGSDLPYFVDYRAIASERLTMVAIPAEGPVTLLVPEVEAPRVEIDPELGAVVAWGDHQRPIEMVRDLLTGVTTAAIGDHTWSRFLLAIQEACPGVRFVPASGITAPLRLVKDDTEIELLGVAADAADRVMVRLAEEHFAGRTERDLARFLATALIEEGHEVAEFAIVASGRNAASPHHEATDRVVGPGDTVVADFGGSIGGYFSDTTRTFSVGEPSAEVAAAHEALETAQQAGFEAVRPGATAEAVDDATRRVLADAGFAKWFIHRTGHGIRTRGPRRALPGGGQCPAAPPGDGLLRRAGDLRTGAVRDAHRGHRGGDRGWWSAAQPVPAPAGCGGLTFSNPGRIGPGRPH